MLFRALVIARFGPYPQQEAGGSGLKSFGERNQVPTFFFIASDQIIRSESVNSLSMTSRSPTHLCTIATPRYPP